MVATKITEERYEEAQEGYEGFCLGCRDFTRFETEPDAERYPCPRCGKHRVVGAENALVMGAITFGED